MTEVKTEKMTLASFNNYREQHGWPPVHSDSEMQSALADIAEYQKDPAEHIHKRKKKKHKSLTGETS